MEWLKTFRKRFPFVCHAVILTPILALIALITTGAGHGIYFILKLFYPYSVLLLIAHSGIETSTADVILSIGFLLYILYGVILTIAERKGRLKEAAIIVAIAHFAAFVFCLILKPLPF